MRRAVLALAALVLNACDSQEPAQRVDLAATQTSPSEAPAPPSATPAANTKSAKSPPAPTGAQQFLAFGTEPFWGLKVYPGKLVFDSPEVPEGVTFDATMKWDGKRRVYTGTLQGKPMLLTIEPCTCNDGMSDRIWHYKAEFTRGSWTVQGCAVPE